jgi:hypothetical protein
MTSRGGEGSRLLLDALVAGRMRGRGLEGMGSGVWDSAVEDKRLRTSSALGCVRPRTGFRICFEGIDGVGGGVAALKGRW